MKFRKLLTFATLSLGLGLTALQAQSGKSLKLNGTDQYMSIPHHNDFNISPTENFTITAYVKAKKYGGDQRFVAKRLKGNGDNTGYELWGANSDSKFYANNAPNASNNHAHSMSVWSSQRGALDTWVHIAIVVDRANNKMFLYQNGAQVGSSGSKDVSLWSVTNPFDVIIGAAMNGSTDNFTYYFNGEIDNLRFWKKALSATEIVADKDAATADADQLVAAYDFEDIEGATVPDISNSPNKHDGTLVNFPIEGAIAIASFTVDQVKFKTGRSNTQEAIVNLNLKIGGNQGEVPKLKKLKFTMEGTTTVSDVKAINVLLKNDNGDSKVIGTTTPTEGEIEVTLDESEIGTMKSQISVAYDVKEDAVEGNKLDAKLIELELSNDTKIDLNAKGNPDGSREILLVRKRLFAPGDYGSKNYRIPAVITAKDGSLVALTDKRKNNESDLPQDIDVVVRRSTDMGLTWSDPVTVAEGQGYGKGYGDAALVMAEDGTLITTFVGGMGLRGTNGNIGRTYIAKSTDNGETWTEPIDITDQLYGPNCTSNENQRQKWVGVFCASGNGLCTRDGRIIFVAGAKVQGGSLDNYLFYSDDKGETWNVSSRIKQGGDEAKVVELNNGDLLVSIRHGGYGSGTKPRPWVRSTDGGKTWTESGSWSEVKDPACNGDMIYYTSKKNGYDKNRLLHSIPYSDRGQRENVSVLVSYNEGVSWPIKRQISNGSSAYSSLCKLQDGTIGIYVEETDPTTAKGYSLYFMRFSLKWLTEGQDEYKAPNPAAVVLERPTLTPDPKEKYIDEVEVSITHPTEGVVLHYTLDGTDPTAASPVYSEAIKLTQNTEIRVIAMKDGSTDSDIVSAFYKVRKSGEYETWDEESNPRTGTDRVVKFLTVEGATVKGQAQNFKTIVAGENATEQSKIVFDNTADVLKATIGDKLTLKAERHSLQWMHYYVYVDWNHNFEFEDDELVSFSQFSEDENTWLNSAGETVLAGPDPAGLPTFEVPETAKLGKTRVRFKVDWNSKEPNGHPGPDNKLSENRGTICDFTIDVLSNKTAIETLTNTKVKVYIAGGQLHMVGLEGLSQVAIYNTAGQLLDTFKSNGYAAKALKLAKGVYIVRLTNGNNTYTYKVSL